MRSNSITVAISIPKRALRFGDKDSGHYPYPPRPNDQGSPNVFVNGKPWHRKGDHWPSHCAPPGCHESILKKGSSTVFVNNKEAGRVGDPIACGGFGNDGSPNVFSGD